MNYSDPPCPPPHLWMRRRNEPAPREGLLEKIILLWWAIHFFGFFIMLALIGFFALIYSF